MAGIKASNELLRAAPHQPGTHIKRLTDLVFSLTIILLLLPLLFVVAFMVRLKLGAPVFFVQKRPGRHGQCFRLYKFRTMTDECSVDGTLLSDHERLTSFGAFLRKSSIDELPELFNVLKGEMSLVGPRPLLMEYLPYYTPEENRRHDILPGITGWAQIHGRNHIPWDERLMLDVWYVDHRSTMLDLQILLQTIGKVLSHDGVAVDTDTVETNLHEERAHLHSSSVKGI